MARPAIVLRSSGRRSPTRRYTYGYGRAEDLAGIVIVTLILLSIILALANWWDDIFNALRALHIYINLAGYLFLSTGLLALWLVAVFFFALPVITPWWRRLRGLPAGAPAPRET